MKKKLITIFLLFSAAAFAVVSVAQQDAVITDNAKELFKQVQLFADAITLISTDYVEPVKVKDLVYGAIKGMMGTLDGYSQFLDPDSFREITEETKGQFGGVGIEIGMREGVLTVIAPIDDTPAFKAGLQAGDKIVKIDGEVTRDLSLDDSVKKLRGDPGTEVTITVIREGIDKLLDFKIKRAVIKLKSIKDARVIEENIGYIRLSEFQEPTAKDLRMRVKKLVAAGAVSLIIDLRNNPGGLLDASVETADQFLEPGALIVYTEGRDPKKRMEFRSKKRSDFDELDLVLVVNKGSASAAEILAGAIQDNKRGLIVGETTFGKGSVQTVIPLKDKSALRLTTAAYMTPSGRNLRDKGIDPDVAVKLEKTGKKKKRPESDRKKDELFDKLDKRAGEREKGRKKEQERTKEDKFKMDGQIRAAVNILKGYRVLESYRSFEEKPPKDASGNENT